MLHYALVAVGFALILWGAVTMYLMWAMMDNLRFAYAAVATLGAVWWTWRMNDHAEDAERRCRMWS